MDGVTILSECSNVEFYVCAGIFLCLMIILAAFAWMCLLEQEYLVCFISVIFALTMAVSGMISTDAAINTIRYKVIADDSVSFNEFMEVYNIVERDGDIYTVDLRIE